MNLTNVTFISNPDKPDVYHSMSCEIDGVPHSIWLERGGFYIECILRKYIEEGEDYLSNVPAEFQVLADQRLFEKQLRNYTTAAARLAQYVLADGRAEVTEMQDGPNQLTDSDGALQFDSDGAAIYEQVEVVTVTAIDPLPATVTQTQYDSDGAATEVEVTNPLITKDSEERAAAQAIVDATPQPVIDEYNS